MAKLCTRAYCKSQGFPPHFDYYANAYKKAEEIMRDYYTGYDDEWDNDEDLFDDGLFDISVEEVGNDSVNGGVSMSSAQVGQQFTTGNSTVRGLNVGTVLQVVAPSTLEIVEVYKSIPEAGDRIDTKYGPATVVRQSSRLDFELDENEVLYVADSDPVVRRLAI